MIYLKTNNSLNNLNTIKQSNNKVIYFINRNIKANKSRTILS